MMYRFISWGIIIFACFYGIDQYPLFDDNEGYYAAIARDMLHNRDFIIPHLNGVPYIEKPPMLYWLMALSMTCLGEHDWAAHLVPALALFATTILVSRFITRIAKNEAAGQNESIGLTAAFLLSTSLPMLAMERMIMCDMVMTCFLTAALMQFFYWQQKGAKRHLLMFWGLLALAVLSKGFVTVVLAMGAIGVFHVWQRLPLKQLFKIFSPAGIGMFLLIAAPWLIAATIEEPGFAWFYFINEHVLRFLNKREPHDYYTGPPWYYLPRIIGYLVPWTFFLLLFTQKNTVIDPTVQTIKRFLGAWFWFSLTFFSLSGGKANYYMLAGIPPLAIGIALQWENISSTSSRIPRSIMTGCFLVLALMLVSGKVFCIRGIGDFYNGCQGISDTIVISYGIGIALLIALCWRLPQRWLPPLLAANIFCLLPLLISGADMADGRLTQKEVADYFHAHSEETIAIYHDFEEVSSLAFYMKNPLYIVDSKSDDLLYGKQTHPDAKTFVSLADWQQHSPTLPLVVMNKKLPALFGDLKSKHLDTKHVCIDKRFDRVAIVRMCEKGTL